MGMEQSQGAAGRHSTGWPGWAVCTLAILLPTDAAEASLLAEVLDRIARMGPSPLAAIMVNASVNAPAALTTPRHLAQGMRVIVGYAASGAPVEAVAGQDGLLITPETADNMRTGLAAGLYPIGSAVFSLPPAGQLSLYEADRDGLRLQRATEMALATVDGSITTIIDGLLLPDLAPLGTVARSVAATDPRALRIDQVTTTVLGAVNSGEIVSAIAVDRIVDALARPQDDGHNS